MAGEKTQVQLNAQIDAGIKVNGNREIIPPIHNAIEKAIVNSSLNKKDGGILETYAYYLTDLVFDDDKQLITKKYVDDSIVDGDFLTQGLNLLTEDLILNLDGAYKQIWKDDAQFLGAVRYDGRWSFGTQEEYTYPFNFVSDSSSTLISLKSTNISGSANVGLALFLGASYKGGLQFSEFGNNTLQFIAPSSNANIQLSMSDNIGLLGSGWGANNERVVFLGDAVADPVDPSTAGNLIWSKAGAIKVNSNFQIFDTSKKTIYGDGVTNGSVRMGLDSGDFLIEKLIAGVWNVIFSG